jgi:hypothetical protein
MTVGRWTLMRQLGEGGSGTVWIARDDTRVEVALKILWRQAYVARFQDEIKLYRQLGDWPGVLPLLDADFPDQAAQRRGARPWLAMAIGMPIRDHLGPTASLASVVEAVKGYAETLAGLAEEGIFHRDIKPPNLYWSEGQFALGDFGIADFPDKAGLTKTGEKLGPANFLAPEMIEHSGEVQSGPADVYSLAKTLWALAAQRKYPPPGEFRRDRANLRLSTHVQDGRAAMLESLLERTTADEPAERPSMRQVAEELAWWEEPVVLVRADLASYVDEVMRLHEATALVAEETPQQRILRLYHEAGGRVAAELFTPLREAVESIGLQSVDCGGSYVDGWPPTEYGGASNVPCWGIGTLASPVLAASVGVVHRSQPEEDLEDLAVTFILAKKSISGQHNYLEFFERFRPGSLGLDRIIERVRAELENSLPDVMADFLTTCKNSGVPRIS